MKNYAQFVDLVNRYLERQERSAAWLSKQIGRHQATVSKWLSEHKRPGSPEIVVRMAAALELGVAECNELLKLAHYPHRVEDLRETVTDQDTQRAIAALDRRSSASSPVQATPSSAPLMPMQLHHPPPAPSSHAPPQFAEVLLEYVSKTFNEAYIDRREFGQLMRQLHEEISLIRKGLADAALLGQFLHTGSMEPRKRPFGNGGLLAHLAVTGALASGEQQEHFLAAMNLEEKDIQAAAIDREHVLKSVLEGLQGVHIPFLLLDKYQYILATNSTMLKLFSISPGGVKEMFDSSILRYNLLAIMSSEDFQGYAKEQRMEFFYHTMPRTLHVFRSATLASRFSPDYMILARELQRFPSYKAYAEQVATQKPSVISSQRSYQWRHPVYGHLRFLTITAVTPTPYGALNLITYVPQGPGTEEVFRSMADDPSFGLIPLSEWRP